MSIKQQIDRIKQAKNEILQVLGEKGVTVPDNATIGDIPDLVSNISASAPCIDLTGYSTDFGPPSIWQLQLGLTWTITLKADDLRAIAKAIDDGSLISIKDMNGVHTVSSLTFTEVPNAPTNNDLFLYKWLRHGESVKLQEIDLAINGATNELVGKVTTVTQTPDAQE